MSMSRITTTLAVALAVTGFGVFAGAAEPAPPGAAQHNQKADSGLAYRASDINGMVVADSSNEKLGTIHDLVMDVKDGKIRYAAVAYGGVAGLGDKLFAVSWDSFKQIHNEETGEHRFLLDVDQKSLENRKGFDQDNWPDRADGTFSANANVDLDAKVGENRLNADIDADANAAVKKGDLTHRVSKIIGMNVQNDEDKDLGSVNDVVIDMDTGLVRYVAVSYGGLAGLGDSLFAVPYESFTCERNVDAEGYHLVLNVPEEVIRKAEGFDQDDWPNLSDPKFRKSVNEFYRTTRKPTDKTDQ